MRSAIGARSTPKATSSKNDSDARSLEQVLDLSNVRRGVPGLEGMRMKFGGGYVSEARDSTPKLVRS